MTKKSSPPRSVATWLKRAGTRVAQCGSWLLICIVSAVWYLLVLLVLLPWLCLDFLPKRRSKPLTSPPVRKLQIPLREGSDIFALMPDGTKVALEPLEASRVAQMWTEVVSGAWCYEKTRLRDDSEA